ncbi:hypothetical protein EDD85DRAFT_788783 [Armillaria nabsnona]|nr:hypothetical protein EDD85DRAFT_788783 [Armillaria nabsnona]
MASIQSTVATNGPAASSKNAMILRINELGEIIATLMNESKQLKKGQERDQARIQALEGEVAQIKEALMAMKAQSVQVVSLPFVVVILSTSINAVRFAIDKCIILYRFLLYLF